MSEITERLQLLPFWKRLNEEEKAYIHDSSAIRTYARGSVIYCSGADCLGLTILLSGEVRACMTSEEGREVTLFCLHGGDICMLTASCAVSGITFDTQIIAGADCRMLVIAPSVLRRLTEENIYARCCIYELAAERFSLVMSTMQDILFKGFDRRLAKFLVSEYERTGNAVIRMTHEQIAQYTSSAREVVARMLKRFSEDGVLEAKRGEIRLIDVNALKQLK